MEKIETFDNVWDALADTPAEAANLQARGELILLVTKFIRDKGWKQAEAAEHCGVTQPRMNDLLRGRVSRFSIDALVNIVSALGMRVHFDIEELEAA
ncbi:XRE family transcriptional regulator [Oxalobacteraceae bacterium OTU3CINTB1]|nr:XRE family transcriptional regulator [Oxalobacteraceae bacterium OTU3CINTB1]